MRRYGGSGESAAVARLRRNVCVFVGLLAVAYASFVLPTGHNGHSTWVFW